MLRRRRKGPRPLSPHEAGRGTSRSHRRPRADAEVPPELVLTPESEARTRKPAREPEREKPPREKAPAPAREKPPAPPREKRAPRGAQDVVLVTGFEPFGGDDRNPSWEVCERLPGEIAGLRVEVCRVPCEFRRAIEVVAEAIERHRPALVVCLGLAAGRTHMGVERVAINVDDARIPDNAGMQPVDEPIAAGGPPAYFATLPVKAMVAAMRAEGVPAEVSNSAGTYVCNHLMYGVLHYLAASGTRARAGFIHVPSSEEMALDSRGKPSMALATMVRGVEAAIAAAQGKVHDVKLADGALD
jgi:pyroglutamyl-peptidase